MSNLSHEIYLEIKIFSFEDHEITFYQRLPKIMCKIYDINVPNPHPNDVKEIDVKENEQESRDIAIIFGESSCSEKLYSEK